MRKSISIIVVAGLVVISIGCYLLVKGYGNISLILLGSYMFGGGFYHLRNRALVKDIPTARLRSIPMGLVEVTGTVKPLQDILTAPLSRQECVFYRTFKRQGSRHMAKVERCVPFVLADDSGSVQVSPHKAYFDVEQFTASGQAGMEYLVKPGDQLYVMGTAARDESAEGSIVITGGSNNSFFWITDRTEKRLVRTLTKWIRYQWLVGGGILAAGVVWSWRVFGD